jgi:DHA2 family multidrug resistance protein
VIVAAPAIGPTVGGWITDNYQWRWIFYMNVPVGMLSLLLVSRLVEGTQLTSANREGRPADT